MNIGDLYFTFRGDSQQLVADAQRSGAAAGDASGKSFGEKFKSQLTMANLGKGVAQGLGLGAGFIGVQLLAKSIGAVTDIMGDSLEAFRAEEASIALLTEAVKANDASWDGNMAAIEDVIAGRERLAFSDDEQRESLRTLVAVTKSHEEALNLQAIAMDLARLRGLDLKTAGDIIGKVYGGNTGILTRYGIQLDKGTTSTEALLAVQKLATGQAEAYAETVEGRQLVSQIRMNNAMEKIGEILAPISLGFAEFAADVLPPLVDGLVNVADAFHNVWRWMNPGLAIIEDTEKAIRLEAEARGEDADAAVAQFRAANDLASAQARVLELDRAIARETDPGGNLSPYAQSLVKEREKVLALANGQETLQTSLETTELNAEAVSRAVAFMDTKFQSLPQQVTIPFKVPGASAAIDLVTRINEIASGISLPRFSDPIPRPRAGVGRASGGPMRAGLSYVLGERGPEVVDMGWGGNAYVHPTDSDTTREVIGGRGGDTFSVTVNGSPNTPPTPMEYVRQTRRMARFGVIEPRRAAEWSTG